MYIIMQCDPVGVSLGVCVFFTSNRATKCGRVGEFCYFPIIVYMSAPPRPLFLGGKLILLA